MNENVIYTYRYLWKQKDSENVFVKVLCGLKQEHEHFVNTIQSTDKVVSCTRVYMNEMNPDLLENYEPIKTEDKKE